MVYLQNNIQLAICLCLYDSVRSEISILLGHRISLLGICSLLFEIV